MEPAASALGVLGTEVFAGWPPSGGRVERANPHAGLGTGQGGRDVTDNQWTWECACAMNYTAGHFVPHPRPSRHFFWFPKLTENLETSYGQNHERAK